LDSLQPPSALNEFSTKMYNVYIKVQAKRYFHLALQDVFWHHKDELDLDEAGLDGTDVTVLVSVIAHSLKPVSINHNFKDFVGDIFCFHIFCVQTLVN